MTYSPPAFKHHRAYVVSRDPSWFDDHLTVSENFVKNSESSEPQQHLSDYQTFLIGRLPEIYQVTLSRWSQGWEEKEIADFLGLTQPAISFQLSDARKRLKILGQLPRLLWYPQELYRRVSAVYSPRKAYAWYLSIIYWRQREAQDFLGLSVGGISNFLKRAKVDLRGDLLKIHRIRCSYPGLLRYRDYKAKTTVCLYAPAD